MTGNAPAGVIRMPGHWFNGDNTPCEQCGGHLPDHDWADLKGVVLSNGDERIVVVDCSGEVR